MKRYSPGQKAPMKFHHLYVWILNPLNILVLAALAALTLLTVLNIQAIPDLQSRLDGNGAETAQILLWIMFGCMALSFLFALVSEILLAKRRTLGALILVVQYVMSTASAALTLYNERTTDNLIALCIAAVISLLVCIYYWKRRRLFH